MMAASLIDVQRTSCQTVQAIKDSKQYCMVIQQLPPSCRRAHPGEVQAALLEPCLAAGAGGDDQRLRCQLRQLRLGMLVDICRIASGTGLTNEFPCRLGACSRLPPQTLCCWPA